MENLEGPFNKTSENMEPANEENTVLLGFKPRHSDEVTKTKNHQTHDLKEDLQGHTQSSGNWRKSTMDASDKPGTHKPHSWPPRNKPKTEKNDGDDRDIPRRCHEHPVCSPGNPNQCEKHHGIGRPPSSPTETPDVDQLISPPENLTNRERWYDDHYGIRRASNSPSGRPDIHKPQAFIGPFDEGGYDFESVVLTGPGTYDEEESYSSGVINQCGRIGIAQHKVVLVPPLEWPEHPQFPVDYPVGDDEDDGTHHQ